MHTHLRSDIRSVRHTYVFIYLFIFCRCCLLLECPREYSTRELDRLVSVRFCSSSSVRDWQRAPFMRRCLRVRVPWVFLLFVAHACRTVVVLGFGKMIEQGKRLEKNRSCPLCFAGLSDSIRDTDDEEMTPVSCRVLQGRRCFRRLISRRAICLATNNGEHLTLSPCAHSR